MGSAILSVIRGKPMTEREIEREREIWAESERRERVGKERDSEMCRE